MADRSFNDIELWSRFKAGDPSSFASIYRQHVRALYSFGKQLVDDGDLVADAVQELFIYIWERRAHLGDTDNIRHYLFKALRRRLIDAISKQQRTVQVHETTVDRRAAEDSIEQTLIKHQADIELRALLQQALRQLTKRQREAIFLRFFGKMSFREVADIMSLSLKSTYNLIAKALDELRKHFPLMLAVAVAMLG
ncbi:RNA polymerase sigma factor [Parapedobacter koreensis]|uniref:RNA polymerase sigma factor, sigma-70 family n=1 Tax=Parapedobacter koreensis TaxID=332977 RepID=A0A1H7S0U9_9SPHI|nr:sigma-70 family RNA polymerase sigma factor [Parapedobacter koreensis]SEL66085.1 RNA polymerase sigma factor, sigma-70 family [Parapedobacter koreensis]